MRPFVVVAWVIGAVITTIDIISGLTHGYKISADHAIAILLIANVAAVRELWVKSQKWPRKSEQRYKWKLRA